MTKIYKINNKHVPFSLNDDPRVTLAALLEALEDKVKTCEICGFGQLCSCVERGLKPKQVQEQN